MRALLATFLIAAPLAAQAQPMCSPATAGSCDAGASTSAGQTSNGSPFSNRASNIEGGGSHAEIAPRLPDPDARGDDTHALLVAADKALAHNKTGDAQEALERAETRVLSRDTDPTLSGQPDTRVMVRLIAEARQALGQKDVPHAKFIVEHLLNPG